MHNSFWKRFFSGLSIVSILLNSIMSYGIAATAYAQEATPSAVLETTLTPSPTSTLAPTIADLTPAPSATPSATISPDPSPTVTPDPTSTPTPEASPSATPEITPVQGEILDGIATESASLSQKVPLRKTGDLLKETKKQTNKNYVEGEVIVKFKENKINLKGTFSAAQAFVFEQRHSLDKKDEIKSQNIQVFKSKKSTEETVKELKADSSVEYAEPNYMRYPATINTNDTYKDHLWGLDNSQDKDIDAPEAWGISEGSPNAIVAVIDSGVAYNHPDLQTNMWDGTNCKNENGAFLGGCNHGYDFENNDKFPLPTTSSHGTHVAGTIAAAKNNSKGIIGVAPNTKIMALKSGLDTASIIKSTDFAIQNGAKIINASYGGTDFSQSEYNAIIRFKNAGGVFVAAAGNASTNNDSGAHSYPSDYNLDNIISVAATDQNDNLASFSDYGATSVDVGAPGVDTYSTVVEITSSEVLNEPFTSVIPPTIPSGWVKTGNWGTYDFGAGAWGKVLYGNLGLPYVSSVDSTVTSASYNLSGASGVDMGFWAACDTEYVADGWHDYMALEVSSNGTDFTEIMKWDEAYLDDDYIESNNGTSGITVDYLTQRIPANYFTNNFKFRLRWKTDSDNNTGTSGDGCKVDNILITKQTLGLNELYDYMDGTSMATPHVAGLAALIWGYNSNLTADQVKNTILQTGDSIANATDKPTVTGKRINAYNALLSLAAPVITGLVNDATPTKSKTWNWDSNDANATYRYLIDQSASSVPTGAYNNTKTATQSSGNGTYYIHVQAKSNTGTESGVTTVSAILDNASPVISINSPLQDSLVSGQTVIGFSDNELTLPKCSIDNTNWVNCSNNVTTLSDITGFNALSDGAFTLYVKDTDSVGNTGSDTESGIIKDSVVPTGSITSPVNNIVSKTTPAFTASANDANGIKSVKFQYKARTSGSYIDLNTDLSAPYEANWTGVNLVSNTLYDLGLVITDNAGNTASVTGVSFTYDATAPTQPIITSPSSTVRVNADNYDIKGTAEAGSLVKIYSSSNLVGSQQLSSLETSFNIEVALTQNSGNNFTVTATDTVGNISTSASVPLITEDSANPIIESYTLDNDVISPQVSPGMKDTATFDLKFSETVDYSIKIKNSSGTVVKSWNESTAANPLPKTWNGKDNDGNYVPDGVYTIEITLTDDADNRVIDTSKTITVNNNPLSLNFIGNKSINEGSELAFTSSANNSEGSLVVYSLINAPIGASINSSTGVFSFTPTEAQGPGNYNFTIKAQSGDLSKSEDITVIVNEVNTAPVASDSAQITNEDTAKTITLSAADSDLPANTLTYSIVNNPSHGTVSLSGNTVTYTPNANYNGSDSLTFKANDGVVDSDTATVYITVNPINDAPVASDDSFSTNEDTAKTITLSATDIDSPDLTYSIASSSAHGTVTLTGNQATYTPNANYHGLDLFTFKANDGELNSNIATISITVIPVDDEPIANAQSVSTNEDAPVAITLSGSDVDGDSLTYSIVSGASHGTLSSISENQVTYTPNANYSGNDSFRFKVTDTNLLSLGFNLFRNNKANGFNFLSLTSVSGDTATVTITINPINDAPIADDQSISADEDASTVVTLSGSDVDGNSLTYSLIDDPEHGVLGTISGNQVTYTPSSNYVGSDSFTFKVSDGILDSNTATVSINVVPFNDPPVLNPIGDFSIDELMELTFTASASDPEGSALTYSLSGAPSGAVIDASTGNFSWTPSEAQGFGDYTFTVIVSDGTKTDSEKITVIVNEVNIAPSANNQSVSLNEDGAKEITLSATDSDLPANTLTYSIASESAHGAVSLSGNVATYTPNTNYNGLDSFTFKVIDGVANSNIATVSITVNPVNDAPVANNSNKSVAEDTVASISVSASDIDSTANSLIYSVVTEPTKGTLGLFNGNTIIYTPNSNYYGSDSFTFKANDGATDSNIATVSITVNPVNDAPVAVNDTSSVNEDSNLIISKSTLLTNDTDVDRDALTITAASNPINGSVSINGDNIIFIPTVNYFGSASFDYTVSDGVLTNTATVSVTVNPVNDAPIAVDDTTATNEDTAVVIATSALLANDTDIDSMPAVTAVGNAVNGTVSLNGTNITFTPTANFNGLASFEYTLSDGSLTDTGLAAVAVNSVNDVPVANIQFISINRDSSLTIILSGSDVEGDTLTYSIVTGSSNGSLGTISGNQITYTPNTGYTGADSFEFKANDGLSDSNTAKVTITVLTSTQTSPNGSGNANLTTTTPQVVISDPTQAVVITVTNGVTNPSINYDLFITGGTGVIPQTTINSDKADIAIPATTVIGPVGWNGVISAPTVTTITLPADSTLGTAIEIGFATDKLSFNKAVRILLPNQAGKKAGYSRSGTTFTEITNICTADNQATGDLLAVDSECKKDVGSDLVIWTKHFTKFATYTQTTNSSSSGGGSSNSGSDGGDGLSDGLGCANHDCSIQPIIALQTQSSNPVVGFQNNILGTLIDETTISPELSITPSPTGEVKGITSATNTNNWWLLFFGAGGLVLLYWLVKRRISS